MPLLAYEDFYIGQIIDIPAITVNQDEMVAFARTYDPQPFHLNEAEAEKSFAGKLIASGWYSCALLVKNFTEHVMKHSTMCCGAGMPEIRWYKPVCAGDVLQCRRQVLDKRISRMNPDLGLVRMEGQLINQHNELVMSNIVVVVMRLREGVVIPKEVPSREPPPGWEPPQPDQPVSLPFIENIEVGKHYIIGSHHFTAQEIISFARLYDPQPFHTDPEAAEHSYLGKLCASGLHSAAMWLTLSLSFHKRAAKQALQNHQPVPRTGTSPGIRNLNWYNPVYAGDTITYRTEITGHKPLKFHSDWGLLLLKVTGQNQFEQNVLSFEPAVIVQKHPESIISGH